MDSKPFGSAQGKPSPATERRRALLAKAHLGQKQMGLDAAEWRVFLRDTTGRDSCRDLDEAALAKLVTTMAARGVRFTAPRAAGKSSGRPLSQAAQARKLRALWLRGHALGIIADPAESALCSWASNSRAKTVTALLQSFGVGEFERAIERLKKWLSRALEQGSLVCPAGHVFPVLKPTVQALLWEKPIAPCPHCVPSQPVTWAPGPVEPF